MTNETLAPAGEPKPMPRVPTASELHRRAGNVVRASGVSEEHLRLRPVGLWDAVRFTLLGQNVLQAYRQQLANLDTAIAQYPSVASNYMKRGEFFLAQGYYARAARDLREALRLAEVDYQTRSWGIVAQSIRDQAAQQLAVAERKQR